MWLRTSCELAFDVSVPVPFVLMLRPRSGARQWIASEEYRLEPKVPVVQDNNIVGMIGRDNLLSFIDVRSGLGISVMSTSHGIMTGKQAREANVGGEVLCQVF